LRTCNGSRHNDRPADPAAADRTPSAAIAPQSSADLLYSFGFDVCACEPPLDLRYGSLSPTLLEHHSFVSMKVFLSSTAQDLVAYRQVADDTILRLSQQAVVMERFGPLPGAPVDECERKARESDVVVCIVAHRFGFVPEKLRGSITQREVGAAKAAGKDVLVWIAADDHPWTEKKEQDLLTDPTVLASPERVAEVAAGVAGLVEFKKWLRNTFVCTCSRRQMISAAGSRSRCRRTPQSERQ
jgi:hypothetical protein